MLLPKPSPPKRPDVEEVRSCTECKSTKVSIDPERGETVCQACGLVLEDAYIDPGPEWRSFGPRDDHRSRTGAPTTVTLHDRGLTTTIGWKDADHAGKSIPQRNRAQLYRMRKWQRRMRVNTNSERTLAMALSNMDRMASGLGLARTVRESAAVIYRRAIKENLIRGYGIDAVCAAALYASCRQTSSPYTLDEVADAGRISRKNVARTYRHLSNQLKLRLPPANSQEYVPRFCNGMDLPETVSQKALGLLQEAEKRHYPSGCSPKGMAAAAIYLATRQLRLPRTQKAMAEACDVTEVTIRNRCKQLLHTLDLTMP